LSYPPDVSKYFPGLPLNSDATAQDLSLKIWMQSGHSASSFNSPTIGSMRIGLHERIIREQFLQFVRAHPLYFVEVVF